MPNTVSNWRSEAKLTLRYALVGLLNSAVGFGVILALTWIGIAPVISNVLGYAAGLAIGFALSRSYVFRSAARPRAEMLRYLLAFAFSYLLNLSILVCATRYTALPPIAAQLAAIAGYVVAMFVCSRFYVFSK